MKQTLTILSLFIFLNGFTQTTISGGNISGTLNLSGSPYLITEDVTIPKDSTLEIEAGVVLDIGWNKKILACGLVKSKGTKANPVTFTCSEDTVNGWRGLYLLADIQQGISTFDYTIFEYSNYNQSDDFNWKIKGYSVSGGGVLAYFTAVRISNCTFQFLRQGLDVHGSTLRIDNTHFQNFKSDGRVGLLDSNDIIIRDCDFNKCNGSIGIARPLNTDKPNISNCYFENNLNGCLVLANEAWADSCTFYKNDDIVVNLAIFKGILSNSTFDSSYGQSPFGTNIRVIRDGSSSIIENCTFKNTYLNGNIGAVDIHIDGGPPTIKNCLFYNGMGIQHTGYGVIPVINCVFYKNRQSIIGRSADIINCLFLDNLRNEVYKTGSIWDEANRRSSCILNQNSTYRVFNSVFWGNRNYFGDNVNATEYLSSETEFYNCIFEGGTSSITKIDSINFIFKGVYQNCIETAPSFKSNPANIFEFSQSCNTLPSGFNKGYLSSISTKYRGSNVSDILSIIKDREGNLRVWDDTADIGPYEIQGLMSRIDIEQNPIDDTVCLGSDAEFSAIVRGVGVSSDWEKGTDGSSYTSLSNSSSVLTLQNVSASDSGTFYRQSFSNQCGDAEKSGAAKLIVKTPVSISLGNSFTMPEDSVVTLSLGGGFSSYLWSTGASTDEITIKGVDLGLGTHEISVETTDDFGCTSSASITITVVKGAGINSLSKQVRLYPNPGSTVLHIEGIPIDKISIYDLQGSLVQTTELSTMNVQSIKNGLYIIKIEVDNQTHHVKWIKK